MKIAFRRRKGVPFTRKPRAVAALTAITLAFSGLGSFGIPAVSQAEAAPANASYLMKITDDPANVISNVDYNYLTYPGFDVLMYNNGYNGTFGDEHLSGITLTLHGQRIAGNGDIHLLPVPEQWDAAAPDTSSPLYSNGYNCGSYCGQSRQYNRTTNTITLPMKYVYDSTTSPQSQMLYDLVAYPEPGGVNLKAILKSDLPTQLENSASFNLEFIPSLYKNKSYQVDSDGDGNLDTFGTFPLAPEDPMDENWPRADLKGHAWYVDQWNAEKGDGQPKPLARGYQWNLASEDPDTKISVTSEQLVSVYDGRNRSQNGWFTMSTRIPKGSKAGETVVSWHIKAPVQSNWVRPTSIAHSQAGYAPNLPKVAVMEIDKNDKKAPNNAKLLRLNADGSYTSAFEANIGTATRWTRFDYRNFDFSSVNQPGTYVIEYNGVRTDPFVIDKGAYDDTWQTSLSGFLATAMDHIEVREGYRIWHRASHMDDARMGEPFANSPTTGNIGWFDGMTVGGTIGSLLQSKGISQGSRIPGLNAGGWFDAGDFDIQLPRNLQVLQQLIYNAEATNNMDNYDTLYVKWNAATGGNVEMHRPDGIPDIVQQVKHGAMQIMAQYKNVGVVSGTLEVPSLRQYTHLGEAATDTDGYIYDKTLGEDEVVERDGKVYSGKNDDRMLMMGATSGTAADSSNYGQVSIDLAGAAAVLKGWGGEYDTFAQECLTVAKDLWERYGAPNLLTAGSRSNNFQMLVQLMRATVGTPDYAGYKQAFTDLLAAAPAGTTNPFYNGVDTGTDGSFLPINTYYMAILALDHMDQTYRDNVIAAVVSPRSLNSFASLNTTGSTASAPLGFAENLTATWGPIENKLASGWRAALFYSALGDSVGTVVKQHVLDSVNYIVGTHPYSDTSWLVGVGSKSNKHPYNSNRADEGFIPGSIVPGYINLRPDFPESLDNFSFHWATNEAIINYPSRFMVSGFAASKISNAAANAGVPTAAAAKDFGGDFMMVGKQTQSINPYTGQPDPMPYETLTTPGFDVFMYNTTFSQIFGDQHCAGVEFVLNGQRIATNGDIHLLPTPEQWDATPAPTLLGRALDSASNTVSASLSLPATKSGNKPEVKYTMKAVPEPGGLKLEVELDKPLPADLAGKAGFNIELIPELYKEKSFQADTNGNGTYDDFGIIPLLAFDNMEEKDRARTDDQAWYVKEWNKDRGDYQPVPIANAKKITLAPESENRLQVSSDSGDIQLLDGRDRAQNGWFVLRTLFPSNSQKITWHVKADVKPSWTRPVNIGHSQAGYTPKQAKTAMMELDPAADAPATASVEKLNADGSYSTVFTGKVGAAKRWTRYDYRPFDFSAVKTPGMYRIVYAGERSDVFPIAANAYSKSWQQTLSGFLAKEMDHIAVRETYKISHSASHMDDSIMWPLCGEPFRDEAAYDGTWFDGQDFCATKRTNTQFNSLEHIPGLAVGGWYDAGDYDLEATRQAGVIEDLAMAYREFKPTYDTLDVKWAKDSGGMVEMHRADGTPDIVQQVRHGVLNVIARFDAIGYNFKVVEVPTLRQYTHLGDGASETDNLIYDKNLGPNEVKGLKSGKQDDRLAMVGEKDASLQFHGAYAMAAAATVLKGYDDELAAKALQYAKRVWDTEKLVLEVPTVDPSDFWALYQAYSLMSAEWTTAIELAIATNGEAKYVDAIKKLWPVMKPLNGFGASFGSGGWKAALVLDYMDDAFKADFRATVAEYKAAYDTSVAANPFGVPDTVGMWGGSTDVVDMGMRMYFLNKQYPDLVSSDYTLRSASYILGTHADNSTSWVSGIGTRSVEHAYGNTRADDTYVAGGIVPGYVPIMPDLPEAKDKFGMMWFESEYVIDTAAKWIFVGNAADRLANQTASDTGQPDQELATAKATLQAAVSAAATLKQADFTATSWAGFAAALQTAQNAALATSGATAADVQAALVGLQTAIAVLQPNPQVTPDTTLPVARGSLQASVEVALTLKQASYTAESWAGFAAALQTAQTVLGDASASAAQMQVASTRLSLAIGLLTPVSAPSTTDRDKATERVNTLVEFTAGLSGDGYTADSWAAFQAALTLAKAAVADSGTTAAQVQAAYQGLLSAVKGLKVPVVTTPPTTAPPTTLPPTTAPPTVKPPVNNPNVTTKSVTVKGSAFKKNAKPKITVQVKLSAGVAKGKVDVYVNSKLVKTVSVAKATTSITLPSKYKKSIKVKAQYKPAKAKVNGTQRLSNTLNLRVKK